MSRRDYYAILGVKRDATPDQLKKAFRGLALKFHPDRNPGDPQAERRFREVAEAWGVLSDPEERSRYDRLGPLYRPDGRPPTPEDLNAFVSEALSGLFRRKDKGDRGEDLKYSLRISLEDVAGGLPKEISILRRRRCTRCDATGAEPGAEGRAECPSCTGTGRSPTRRIFRTACPRCDGRGWLQVQACKRCEGDGMRDQPETLSIQIPAGVATGQKLKLRGQGNESATGGKTGDLFVLIEVREHELFRRRGADVLVEAPLLFSEAALGADLLVPTLDGSTTIRIPAGTPSGKVFRLAGRGLADPRGAKSGDLLVKVLIEVPTHLSTGQADALRSASRTLPASAHPARLAYDEALAARR